MKAVGGLGLGVLGAILLAAAPGAAQAPVRVGQLRVALWPEYDKPAVLVTLALRLAGSTQLPATVDLKIPARVGTPHAVAKRAENGGLFLAEFTREVDASGTWATLHIVSDSRNLHVEYYDALEFDGAARRYLYTWPGGLLVANAVYEALVPVGASGYRVTPMAQDENARTSQGLPLHAGTLGSLAADAQATVTLEYTKSSDALSAPPASPSPPAAASPAAAPPQAMPQEAPPESDPSGDTRWFDAALIALAALALGFFFGRRRR